jgi:hypothetical protein
MTFCDERLRGGGFFLRAGAGARFFGGAILLAAMMVLAAGSARGQSYAPDPMGDGFGAAAALPYSTSMCEPWAEKPGAEAPYLCAASRGPEGPRFHRPFAGTGLSARASRDFIGATELIFPGDSGAADPAALSAAPASCLASEEASHVSDCGRNAAQFFAPEASGLSENTASFESCLASKEASHVSDCGRNAAQFFTTEASGSSENTASFESCLASEEASYISNSGDAELPAAPTPAVPVDQVAPYEPMTGRERLVWIVENTLGPEHLAGGLITSAVGTGLNRPHEYGPHWEGFGKRFGIRLTGVSTSNVMEAGIGALWGEDPRYFPVPEYSFRARVKNVIVMTFLARHPDGDFRPAYARYIAFSGNNFLANAWRPDSEANVHSAVLRTLEGFAGRMAANAWDEFWPQAKGYIFHHGR